MTKILDILSIVLCLVSITITCLIDYSTPLQVPVHYALDGKPDGWGSPMICVFITALSVAMVCLFLFFKKHPQKMSYPFKITTQNKEKAYAIGIQLISSLNFLQTLMFAYINTMTIVYLKYHCYASQIVIQIILLLMLIVIGVDYYRLYKVEHK